MHFPFINRILLLFAFCILFMVQIKAENKLALPQKRAFLNTDIFQSAVFLKNTNIVNNQTGDSILYYTLHGHIAAFFTEKGIIYKLTSREPEKENGLAPDIDKEEEKGEEKEGALVFSRTSIVTMNWIGANPHPQIIAEQKADGSHNYLTKKGRGYTTLTTFGYKKITYRDIYPGIDAVYSFPEEGGIKYDLVVRPGADPNEVKFNYGGNVEYIKISADGDLDVHTKAGEIIEHKPITLLVDPANTASRLGAKPVASSYVLKNHTVQFHFPAGYDPGMQLIVDPWITVLTTIPPANMGFSVDYDATGNLFVYGAGPTNTYDNSDFFEVAEYNTTGAFQWVFNGSVPSIAWNSFDNPFGSWISQNWASNFAVDKITGKVYVGQGFQPDTGTRCIRLNTAGQYDNFVSRANASFVEIWGFAYNCNTAELLALGGGVSSYLNMGVVNAGTGIVAASNVTGCTGGTNQDILCGTYDNLGNFYVIMNSRPSSGPNCLPFNNTIYKVNAGYNGNAWQANSNYSSFVEWDNVSFWSSAGGNWFNALAANGSYLYYYDGVNVAAYDFNSGTQLGSATMSGYFEKMQGGIAVDNCTHVYVGGQGVIKTFTFNGTTFTPGADIPLGGSYSTNAVLDVKYNSINNLLYVTGNGFAGTLTATLTTNCTTQGLFTATATTGCNSATVNVIASPNLSPKVFTFIWTNSAGNIISQTSNTQDTTVTVTGLATGTYYVQIQWNTNCGGSVIQDTVVVTNTNCGSLNLQNETICAGQSATLTATPGITGGTYNWSPGGATTASITVSPALSTTYRVTYIPPGDAPIVDSAVVTVINPPTLNVANDTICSGAQASLTGIASQTGGTYSWSPGSGSTATIQPSPVSTTTYSVTYTLSGCSVTASAIVAVNPLPSATLTTDSASCNGAADGKIKVSAAGADPPFQYSLNNGVYQAPDSFDNLISGNYTVQVKDKNGCTASVVGNVTQPGAIQITAADSSISCFGLSDGKIFTSESGGAPGYTYAWSNGQSLQSITGLAQGSYQLTVTDSHACTVSASYAITQPGLLSIAGNITNVSCFGLSDGSITVSASGGTPAYIYHWNDGSATQNKTQLPTGTYTVTVTDLHLCTASASFTLTQPAALQLGTSFINPTCSSLSNGTINLSPSGGTLPYTFSWSDGANTENRQGLLSGTYKVTITDGQNCTTDTSFTLIYLDNISVVATPSTSIDLGQTITLNYAVTDNTASYTAIWNQNVTLSCLTCVNPIASPTTTTNYVIVATDTIGCVASAIVNITVVPVYDVYIPNVFTPNGDGVNDYFEVFGNKAAWLQFEIQIFDRWGEKVYESEDMNFKWNGAYKGKLLNPAVFVYQVYLVYIDDHSSKLMKGSITLLR